MQLGMKLISASGTIRIQAQDDDIEIIAAKRLRLVGLKAVSIEGPQVNITAQNAGAEYGGGSPRRHRPRIPSTPPATQ